MSLPEELHAENRRLARENAELRVRLGAIEGSRWQRLNPRLFWNRRLGIRARTTRKRLDEPASSSPSPYEDPRTALFRDEVLEQGTFTQTWAIGDLPGWEPLFRELQGRRANILEVGAFEGLSACFLLWRLPEATVTCIDTFTGSDEHRSTDIDVAALEARFDANVALVDAARVRKLVGDSKRRLLDLVDEGAAFDLVYIDGSHLGLDVIVDASLAWRALEVDGIMVFDDYPWAELGEDPLLRPGPAIDSFLTLVADKHDVVFADYQIAVRKLA